MHLHCKFNILLVFKQHCVYFSPVMERIASYSKNQVSTGRSRDFSFSNPSAIPFVFEKSKPLLLSVPNHALLCWKSQSQYVPGSIQGCDILKSLTMVQLFPAWHSNFRGRARTGRPSVSIM